MIHYDNNDKVLIQEWMGTGFTIEIHKNGFYYRNVLERYFLTLYLIILMPE